MVGNVEDLKKTLIKEAEDYEKISKIEVKRQNYEEAVKLLFKAKDKYEQAGLTGQISIIIKKIAHLKNLVKDHHINFEPSEQEKINLEVNHKENLELKGTENLEKAYDLTLNGELENAIEMYNNAYNIYKKLNYDYECKQILWQINEIKEHQRWNKKGQVSVKNIPLKDIVSLSQAEKRRRKIQEQLATPKRKEINEIKKEPSTPPLSKEALETTKPKLLRKIQEQEQKDQLRQEKEEQIRKEVQDIRIQKIRQKQEKLRTIQQKKQEEDKLIDEANNYLDKAKRSLKEKKYGDAKEFYVQSIKIFTSLGWNDQIRTLNQELRNIDIYKKQDQRKNYLKQQKIKQSEELFQKRVSNALSEKERYLEKQIADEKALPSELKLKWEKAHFTRQKAEKEEQLNNFERALARYQYVLELYQSIPTEYIESSEEIKSIEKKISELKEKM